MISPTPMFSGNDVSGRDVTDGVPPYHTHPRVRRVGTLLRQQVRCQQTRLLRTLVEHCRLDQSGTDIRLVEKGGGLRGEE